MGKRKLWGGFVDDRLHFRLVDSGYGGWGHDKTLAPAVFASRILARREYMDVRQVEIREPTEKDDGHGRG